ncbi:MAG: ubiquinone biosynthesis protein UbiE [Acidobacteria bacterium]|nr:MAG: ubiquinone biosynthesis protein UbiE [Acidobacteriota bacterium]
MNAFLSEAVANKYDSYYDTTLGQKVDNIEKQIVASYLRDIPRQAVLELGCGTGHWTEFLSDMGFSVSAVDISEAMLAVATKKSLRNVIFQKADAANLPFSNESFGIIVSITMLEFTHDPKKVLSEIYRVLKSGGLLVLGCVNVSSELGKAKDNHQTYRNATFFSKTELKELLSVFGEPKITECVYLSPAFEILDGAMEKYPVEGAFLAACVRKTG